MFLLATQPSSSCSSPNSSDLAASLAEIAAAQSLEAEGRGTAAAAAYRRALALDPASPAHRLAVGWSLLRHNTGWGLGAAPTIGAEIEALMDELLALPPPCAATPSARDDATVLRARAVRVQPSQGRRAQQLLEDALETAAGELRYRLLVEQGHLFLSYGQHAAAMQSYQTAHDEAKAAGAAAAAAAGKQGGAMTLALEAKCSTGGKGDGCATALSLFSEVDDGDMEAASWMMVGYIRRYVSTEREGAVAAGRRAVALWADSATWWTKLAAWAREVHTRLPVGGFDNDAIRLARTALRRARELDRSSADAWRARIAALPDADADGDAAAATARARRAAAPSS